jgi:VanZ family protein
MNFLFSTKPEHIKRARFAAIVWTLLIFILCFIPGRDIPNLHIPLIDKWAHVILFGVFTYLWHMTIPTHNITYKISLFMISLFVGWMVEYVQGHYVPQRSQDSMDILADTIGGAIGILIYSVLYYRHSKRIAG